MAGWLTGIAQGKSEPCAYDESLNTRRLPLPEQWYAASERKDPHGEKTATSRCVVVEISIDLEVECVSPGQLMMTLVPLDSIYITARA